MKVFFLAIFFICMMLFASAQTKVIVLDAGHGGKDPGAMGKTAKEKDIALKITLKIGEYLTQNIENIKVIYTRQNDVFLTLEERAKIANSNNADLFVSIHVNSSNNKTVYGTQTYVMGPHKTDENLQVALKENSAILYENNYQEKYSGYDPNSPESYIIMNLYQSAYRDMSIKLADMIQKQLSQRAARKDMGVRQAGFLVLWQTTMPSVLVEVGFISNRSEEQFLITDYGQSIIASAIYRAIRDYLKEN